MICPRVQAIGLGRGLFYGGNHMKHLNHSRGRSRRASFYSALTALGLCMSLTFTGCQLYTDLETLPWTEPQFEAPEDTSGDTTTNSAGHTDEEISTEEISTEAPTREPTETPTGEIPTESTKETEVSTENIPETETEQVPSTEEPTETPTEEPTETPTEEPTTIAPMHFDPCDDIVYTTTRLRLRALPSTEADILAVMDTAVELHRIGIGDGWCMVVYNGTEGYVSSDYISLEKPVIETVPETLPPETTPPATGEIVRTETANGILYTGNPGPLIAIDPGHQARGNNEHEPIGPGATETKKKVSYGTSGVATGVAESLLNLTVSLQLRDALLAEGYNVLMIREVQEVDISNATRAMMANNAGVDALIRIHANGSSNADKQGALTVCPTVNNPYLSVDIRDQSRHLSQIMIDAVCACTGSINRGLYQTDTMTGINWCTVPVTILEMGYMSNAEEDIRINTPEFQQQLIQGVCNGFNTYFGRN